MSHPSRHPDPKSLSRFHHLRDLNEIQLGLLADSLRILEAAKGKRLLQRGDASANSLYLLKGRLQLVSDDGRISEIDAQSPQALNPIAQLIPRRYEVNALGPVEYLLIDNQLLDGIMADQPDAFTATEIALDDASALQCDSEHLLTQALLEDLENNRLMLPSLPDIAIRVGREMNEENTDAHRLASVIQTDPVITTKLIRAANSPLYAGITAIESCSAAVIRLGANTTHNLVLTFALRELFITRSQVLKLRMRQLWEHSVRVSAICYVLAKLSDRFDPEHALLAGLLHDIGVVAILSYAKRFPEILQEEARLDRIIHDLRGVIGARILSVWGFLEDLVTTAESAEDWLRDAAQDADYADLVIVAQLHSFIGTPRMRELPTLNQVPAFSKLDMGGLSPQMSLKILDRAQDKIDRAEALLTS